MRQTQLSLFEDFKEATLFAYLMVVSPPDDITAYVNDLKKEFYRLYGDYDSRFSKPHITVCNFLMPEQREAKVISRLQNGLLDIKPFTLHINGFGLFKGSNVIYLDVEKSDSLKSLETFFYTALGKIRINRRYVVLGSHHLTIAKNLRADVFNLATKKYLEEPYQNSFPVEKLTVLKYAPHNKWSKHKHLTDLNLGGQE